MLDRGPRTRPSSAFYCPSSPRKYIFYSFLFSKLMGNILTWCKMVREYRTGVKYCIETPKDPVETAYLSSKHRMAGLGIIPELVGSCDPQSMLLENFMIK